MESMEFAKAYTGMGWAVQAQLHTLMDDPDGEVSLGALAVMYDALAHFDASANAELAEIGCRVREAYMAAR